MWRIDSETTLARRLAGKILRRSHEAVRPEIPDVLNDVALNTPGHAGRARRPGKKRASHFAAFRGTPEAEQGYHRSALVPDAPIEFGVAEFCASCKKCADRCPSRSIPSGDMTAEPINVSNAGGARKWRINAETCRTYWSRVNHGCNNCVACCPYTKPDTWPHRVALWFASHEAMGVAKRIEPL
jgi:hypothetical protein